MTESAPATGVTMPHLEAAADVLRDLSGIHGIRASLTERANYRAIFARDGVMAGIAGVLLREQDVLFGFGHTVEHLRDLQGPQGQIPSNYDLGFDGAQSRISFGTLAPRLDSVGWFLVGVGVAARAGLVDAAQYEAAVTRAVGCLDAIEYNGRHLLFVPTGGNWADEWVYDGYVLYDQVLRAWALRHVGDLYQKPDWLAKADAIAARIEESYWPEDAADHAYPIASFGPTGRRELFDLAACALLAVSGIAPARAGTALNWIARRYLLVGALPPAFAPVIDEGHPEWDALRRYQLHGFRNRPHEYHNGGIWPIWLGWLAVGLAKVGRTEALARLRTVVADRLGAMPDYQFEEYLHGETGRPGGVARMAYSAAGLALVAHADDPIALNVVAR